MTATRRQAAKTSSSLSASASADAPQEAEAINLRTTGETPAIVIDDLADDEAEGMNRSRRGRTVL